MTARTIFFVSRYHRRSDEDWIAALRGGGEETAAAVQDLEAYLRRVLGRIVDGRLATDLAELVQESVARICASLDSFRGDSAFMTWAAAVANRVAFTEMRRLKSRARGADGFEEVEREVEELESLNTPAPHAALSRTDLLAALQRAITTRLTRRQRLAVLAELRGIPTIEIAERLGTNQNALYKLHHDARKKLRNALLAEGFSAEHIHELAGEMPK